MNHEGRMLKEFIFQQQIEITGLAETLDIERSTFYDWMKKERVPFAKKKAIAEALGVDITEIWAHSPHDKAPSPGSKDVDAIHPEVQRRLDDMDARLKKLEGLAMRKYPKPLI